MTDIWRKFFPGKRMFKWSNSSFSQQSRVDFWLISTDIFEKVMEVTTDSLVLSDHKSISIELNLNNCYTQKLLEII